MAERGKEEELVQFTAMFRGKPLHLKASASSTLGELGREIVERTGVAPHTLRLMLPKRPPLQPLSDQQRSTPLHESGIKEGSTMMMMGVSSAEIATVSRPSFNDRTRGFSEEEQRARQRSARAPTSYAPSSGNYIFCDFRTLSLPNIELNPPPAAALRIMRRLASDRGIAAIMNKYRWRVGVMTEMAPIGYVGVSPKCTLGFNKNRGQEISLRLRTDDLEGFRKYESIKKTLLHELAHMVHDEHDEDFHALDKKLNEEAVALDWAKSKGHTMSGIRHKEDQEEVYAGGAGSVGGYRLGGNAEEARSMDARAAAAAAALRRLKNASKEPSEMDRKDFSPTAVANPSISVQGQGEDSQPDPDVVQNKSVLVIAEDPGKKDQLCPGHIQEDELDPTDGENMQEDEPNPEDIGNMRTDEPDPDDGREMTMRVH